jgi:uncharacterized membrane protein YidH (DUF202 family)
MGLLPMVSKLRATLAILSIGFAIEGAIGAYTYLSRSYRLPYTALILILGPFVTLAGVFVLWMGRREWNDLLSRRFRHAHRTFGLGLLALVAAVALLVWSSYGSTAPIDWRSSWAFGAAVMASLLLTFATYVLLALHLTARIGKAILLVALGWAAVVTFWIGQVLAQNFVAIIGIFQTRTLAGGSLDASLAGFESYLAVTYALFIVVYLDAFRRTSLRSLKTNSISVAPPAT